MVMLADVGGCMDIEDMLVVLSRFQYIFGHTAPWLQHEVVMEDEHGDEMVDEDGDPVTEFVLYLVRPPPAFDFRGSQVSYARRQVGCSACLALWF